MPGRATCPRVPTRPRGGLAGGAARLRARRGPLGAYVPVADDEQTTVPGVYAAGDLASAMGTATLASAARMAAGVGAHRSLARGIA